MEKFLAQALRTHAKEFLVRLIAICELNETFDPHIVVWLGDPVTDNEGCTFEGTATMLMKNVPESMRLAMLLQLVTDNKGFAFMFAREMNGKFLCHFESPFEAIQWEFEIKHDDVEGKFVDIEDESDYKPAEGMFLWKSRFGEC